MEVEKGRLGQFFLVIGLILLVVFFSIDQARNPSYGFFFVGVVCIFLGGLLIWRDWKPAPPTGRFRLLQRIRQKSEEKKANKVKKKGA